MPTAIEAVRDQLRAHCDLAGMPYLDLSDEAIEEAIAVEEMGSRVGPALSRALAEVQQDAVAFAETLRAEPIDRLRDELQTLEGRIDGLAGDQVKATKFAEDSQAAKVADMKADLRKLEKRIDGFEGDLKAVKERLKDLAARPYTITVQAAKPADITINPEVKATLEMPKRKLTITKTGDKKTIVEDDA